MIEPNPPPFNPEPDRCSELLTSGRTICPNCGRASLILWQLKGMSELRCGNCNYRTEIQQ